MNKKNIIILVIGFGFGITLFLLWLGFVPIEELLQEIRSVSLKHVIAASVCYLLAYFVRSIRWNILLSGKIKLSLKDTWMYAMGGNLLNYLVPIRAGELAKAWFVKRNHRVSIVQSLPSIFIDKSFDTIAILAVIVLIPFLAIELSIGLVALLALLAVVFVVSIGVLVLAAWNKQSVVTLLQFAMKPFPSKLRMRISTLLEMFVDGLNPFEHHPLKLISAVLLTILGILLDGVYFYLLFIAFGISFPFTLALFGYTLINLSYALPQPPAQLGSNEWMMIIIFSMGFGLTKSSASAIMAFAHVLTAVLISVTGGLSLALSGLEVFRIVLKGEKIDGKPD